MKSDLILARTCKKWCLSYDSPKQMLNLVSKINKRSQWYAWEQEVSFSCADFQLTVSPWRGNRKRASSGELSSRAAEGFTSWVYRPRFRQKTGSTSFGLWTQKRIRICENQSLAKIFINFCVGTGVLSSYLPNEADIFSCLCNILSYSKAQWVFALDSWQ